MNVYRVEDEEGGGAFYTSKLSKAMRAAHIGQGWHDDKHDPYNHPGPMDEPAMREWHNGAYGSRKEWFFGMASLEEVARWFSHPILRACMEAEGLAVSVYWVPTLAEVIKGRRQLVFKRGRKKPRNRIALTSLGEREVLP